MPPDTPPDHDGYRVDTVINGAVERAEPIVDYAAALDYAEHQVESLRLTCHYDWEVTIYDEAPYPPEPTDEWTA